MNVLSSRACMHEPMKMHALLLNTFMLCVFNELFVYQMNYYPIFKKVQFIDFDLRTNSTGLKLEKNENIFPFLRILFFQ